MRIVAWLFVLLALAMTAGGAALFLDPAVGKDSQEALARFGTWFGGVEAPLLTLLTLIGLAITLMMQNRQIELAVEERLLARHVRMLDETWRDMERIEQVVVGRLLVRPLTLRELFEDVEGPVSIDDAAMKRACDAYLKRLGTYARGVHLFRDNFDGHWDYEVLVARGRDALDRLTPYKGYLNGMGPVSLALINHDLHGETSVEPSHLVRLWHWWRARRTS